MTGWTDTHAALYIRIIINKSHVSCVDGSECQCAALINSASHRIPKKMFKLDNNIEYPQITKDKGAAIYYFK